MQQVTNQLILYSKNNGITAGVVKGNLKCYIKLFLYVKIYNFT